MNDYFKKHPLMQDVLILVILLFFNIFFRWSRGYAWIDVWIFSILSTVLIGGGVIMGIRWRRKYDEKNRAVKEKIDELLKKD
ncbi:membrane protein [gut metagenome]|uniref:Membrane protein n=1 Tax=gut metagenome TaxID=749906 RepID=J9FQV0_9ZZZZ